MTNYEKLSQSVLLKESTYFNIWCIIIFLSLFSFDVVYMQDRRKHRGLGAKALAPQFWAKQLTLFQPGGQIMPTTVLRAPPDFQTLRRPCMYVLELTFEFLTIFSDISW